MKKLLLWIVAGILGLLFIALLLLPGIAKNYLVKHSREYIGRPFTIDKIRINYFTTTFKVYGFKLYEQDGKEVFVSFDKMLINLQPLNLLKHELLVQKFQLSGLYANIVQQDSSFNFDDIIEFLNKPADSTESEAVKDTAPSKPLRFRLYDLGLDKAHFVYDDRNVNKATHLRDFSFDVPYIEWGGGKSEAGLSFTTARDGYFESGLNIDQDQGNFIADVLIRKLHLDNFKEYISHYTGIQSLDGVFNCNLRLAGNIYNPESTVISGKAWLEELVMNDTAGKFLGAERIDIGLKNIDYAHSRYELDSIVLTGPYVHFILMDSTDNFTQVFQSPETVRKEEELARDTTAASPSDSLFYSIDALIIRKGVVDYTDQLTGEPFNYHLSGIELAADNITTDADWVNLNSDMLLNERGTLKAQVGFDPQDPMKNLRLDYVITNFQLSDLNIYSKFYTGIPIILGNMYYKSGSTIVQGQLTSENKLVMTDVKLGSKGGGLYDIPIKLALFILRDKYGVINLDVPVRGNLDDPSIKLGKLIWNTFKNLIFKIATKPFDILAQSIGAEPREIEFIEFDYLDTALTAQKQRQLELLLQLEEQKPGLRIDLTYYNDAVKEKELIAAEDQKYHNEDVLQAEADRLAWARLRVLEEHLHAVNDSTAIRFNVAGPDDPKNTGSRPVFGIVYSLMDEDLEN